MKNTDKHKLYTLETRKQFSNIVRGVFGDEPKTLTITDYKEIKDILMQLSSKLYEDKRKMSYVWWWRGSGSNHLEQFEIQDNYFYMNRWKMRIKELYINISPVPLFDFIIFRVHGESNDIPLIKNYEWANGYSELNLDRHTINDFSIREYINDGELCYFKQPYNFILTAQFGLPNLNIYTDDEIGKMLNKLLFGLINFETFKNWYTQILIHLKKRIDDFYNYLEQYPMLSLENELGKHIYNNLIKLGTYELNEQTFCRARQLRSQDPYDEANMWNPPADKVAVYEGRYNHFGQSFLYLADDEDTAFKEVIPEWHKSCSMVQIKIQKPIKVLDLRRVNFYSEDKGMDYIILHYMLVHEGTISQETKNDFIKPEYLVPRFVADCARLNEFEGILFNSTKGKGDNAVLFEPESLKNTGRIATLDKPYIYTNN